ncbi:hypothetical protein BKA62DRAFT_93380 [Auriculariales sp. MPI-PUGE-AT-0066]|nr:hypothetical protein BKA62DRAFT_93380 [Auriculariales sp. MPI-PUGE-AT-0066]
MRHEIVRQKPIKQEIQTISLIALHAREHNMPLALYFNASNEDWASEQDCEHWTELCSSVWNQLLACISVANDAFSNSLWAHITHIRLVLLEEQCPGGHDVFTTLTRPLPALRRFEVEQSPHLNRSNTTHLGISYSIIPPARVAELPIESWHQSHILRSIALHNFVPVHTGTPEVLRNVVSVDLAIDSRCVPPAEPVCLSQHFPQLRHIILRPTYHYDPRIEDFNRIILLAYGFDDICSVTPQLSLLDIVDTSGVYRHGLVPPRNVLDQIACVRLQVSSNLGSADPMFFLVQVEPMQSV